MSASPAVLRRLMKELSELQNNPPEGVRVIVNEGNVLDVTGVVAGPEGTPYAGGYFQVKFKFTEEFPAAPPKCWFATKIFHPNVSSAGEICVNTLKKDWKSSYGIAHILVTVKCLLIFPNPDSALDEEAGKLLQENYDDYCARARLITSVHATPRVKPAVFETEASTSTMKEQVVPSTVTLVPSTPVTTTLTPKKADSIVPAAPSQLLPLQCSPSNQPSPTLLTEKSKERLTSPAPLGIADANVATVIPPAVNITKAVKRAGAPAETKRKKALKRL